MNEYFRELRNLGQQIDGDIRKLEKTWETPELLIGGYGINFEEASPYVERFFGSLKEVQDQLIEGRESQIEYMSKTAKYLAHADTLCKDLKKQCQDMETLLSEYGYKPLPDSIASLAVGESQSESSSLTPNQIQNNEAPSPRSTCHSLNEK